MQTMLAVLGTVPSNHFVASIISFKREGNFENVSTWFYHLQNTIDFLMLLLNSHLWSLPLFNQLILNYLARFVVKVFHHVEEEWVFSRLDTL